MKKFILLGLAVFLFGSCVTIITKGGGVSSGPLLNIKDKYIGYAKGNAKIKEVQQPYDQENINSLILEAKLDMYKNRPLKEGEYYSNFSWEFTYKYVRIQDRLKSIYVMVSADVLSQTDTMAFSTFVNNNARVFQIGKSMEFFKLKADTFRQGEIVYANLGDNLDEYDKLEFLFISEFDVQVKYLEKGNATERIRYGRCDFYSTKKANAGYKAGDKTKLISVYDKNKVTDATVMGVNSKMILVSTDFGRFLVSPDRLKK